MSKILFTLVAILLCSCAPKSQDELPEFILESSETIEHIEQGDHKIQIVYSTLNVGMLAFLDTSIVFQQYQDTLLIEEIHYHLENGDSIKWSHFIKSYNSNNKLTGEIDSVDGSLRNQNLYFYDNGKIHHSEHLSILPKYNEIMELVGADTMRSIVYSFYNDEGKCNKVMALSKDELTSELIGNIRYDTILTFNEFDEKSNQIKSVSLTNGDTTSITQIEYDQLNRKTVFIGTSHELGATTIKYKYDERGNRIDELLILDDFMERTVIEYDELSRPIKKQKFKPETLTNNSL